MTLTKLTKGRARWQTFKLKLAKAVSRSLYEKLLDQGVSIKDFGASSSNSSQANKEILQDVINLFKGKAITILIPSDINYGYTDGNKSTFPDFSSVNSDRLTRIVIKDYSLGSTGTTGVSGAQERTWMCTGTEYTGQHNGNGTSIRGQWHPYMWIDTFGDLGKMGAGKNRRASLFFGSNGISDWRVGMGTLSGEYTEDELKTFVIAANGLKSIGNNGLTSCVAIRKDNGCLGVNISQPRYPIDLVARNGQPSSNVMSFTAADNKKAMLILQGGGEELRLVSATAGYELQNKKGALYKASSDGGIHAFFRKTDGNITLSLAGMGFKRDIVVRSDNKTISITDPTGVTEVLQLDQHGNLTVTGNIYANNFPANNVAQSNP